MTDTITVLRLEDANGGGCFSVADMQDYTTAAVRAGLMSKEEDAWGHFHTSKRGCPGPYNDYELKADANNRDFNLWDEGCRFGFPDAEVAREWFPPCMADALEANGQTLTIWEVPEDSFATSDRQCVFDRDRATLVERLPVSALYDDTLLKRQLPLPLAA